MKTKFCALMIAIFIGLVALLPVAAQNCGGADLSVVYPRVDNLGYAPRFSCGDENQFNRIAAHDPTFNERRFPDAINATNYWLMLLGQEWGVIFGMMPTPTS